MKRQRIHELYSAQNLLTLLLHLTKEWKIKVMTEGGGRMSAGWVSEKKVFVKERII